MPDFTIGCAIGKQKKMNDKATDKKSRWKILPVSYGIIKEYPREFLLITFMLACSSVFEVIGISFMIPLMGNLFGGDLLQGSQISALLEKAGVAGLHTGGLLLFIVGFMGVRTALMYYSSVIAGRTSVAVEFDIREQIFNKVLQATWPFFISMKTGNIINMATQEATQAGYALLFLGRFYIAAVLGLFFLAAAIFFSFKGFLLMVVISGPLLLAGSVINRKTRKAANQKITYSNLYNSQLVESFSQSKLIKSTDGVENAIERQRAVTADLERVQHKNIKYISMTTTLPDGFLLIVLVVIIAMSQWLQVSAPADFVLFLLLMFRAQRFIGAAQSAQQRVATFLPSFISCKALIKEASVACEDYRDKGVQPVLANAISLKNINFFYKPQAQVLHGINVEIPVRKTIAFAGKSGSGKTTLIDLITGLLVPTDGEILIDGVNLREINLHVWRQKIAYVPQEPVLFNGSIRENIMRDAPRDEGRFNEVVRLANVEEFVSRMPESYETNVNDRGISLSGGQKQRVALARALMREPEILVLDEATSALDTISEDEIKKSIAALKNKMTIIVIAHRFSTIRDADMIYVIDDGRVAQQGTYDELAKMPGTFAQLAQL